MTTARVLGALAILLVCSLSSARPKKAITDKKEWGSDVCMKSFLERQKLEAEWTDEQRGNSTAGKCWIACVMQKRGLVRAGGADEARVLQYVQSVSAAVNADFRRTRVDAAQWGALVRKCVRQVNTREECELGYNVWHCLLSNMRISTSHVSPNDDQEN